MITKQLRLLLAMFSFLLFASVVRATDWIIENQNYKYVFNNYGRNISFIDKSTGINYLKPTISNCASVVKNGITYNANQVTLNGEILTLFFSQPNITVNVKINTAFGEGILWEVISISGDVESLTFLNIPLSLQGTPYDTFGACALGMNPETRVSELPVLQSYLQAICYNKFGIVNAKAVVIGASVKDLLPAIKSVMRLSTDIPYSTEGGAWAKTATGGYASYIMNFGTLTTSTVNQWIDMCADLGFNQIDNHGSLMGFFTFGDLQLNSSDFPGGWDDFKLINQQLHDAGILSSLHTYSYYIDLNSSYVTPVPNRSLAYDKTFTLSQNINSSSTAIIVTESTTDIAIDRYGSPYIRIGDELINFSGVTKTAPYKFTECIRGALGTYASAHSTNDSVYRLRHGYSRFIPTPGSALFSEIAKRTADVVNYAGFDGVYFDALDNLGGSEDYWYYEPKFVIEVAKNLTRSVFMEMSSMLPSYWNYRSRWQAWDKPVRGYQKFIDIHLAFLKINNDVNPLMQKGDTSIINKIAIEENSSLMLPLHLGWWEYHPWQPPQIERTFIDDIQYLTSKMIGNNAGLSILGGMTQNTLTQYPQYVKFNELIKQSEILRHQNYFNDSIRKILRQPGKNFRLYQQTNGDWNFKPITYQKFQVTNVTDTAFHWTVNNEYEPQSLKLRIEAFMRVKSYNDLGAVTMVDGSTLADITKNNATGVSGDLVSSNTDMEFSAYSNGTSPQNGSWIKFEKTLSSPLNISSNQGIGLWIDGDGNGEILNIRLQSNNNGAKADHYIKIDFVGKRYFELLETESSEYNDFIWDEPYNSLTPYSSYREQISYNEINRIQLWYNNIPAWKNILTRISAIKALPLMPQNSITLTNPRITMNGKDFSLLVSMQPGMYLELQSATDCKLYGTRGEYIKDVTITGEIPTLNEGKNDMALNSDRLPGFNPRMQVSVITEGAFPLITAIDNIKIENAKIFAINPNPVRNGSAVFTYNLPEGAQPISIEISDVQGRKLETLNNLFGNQYRWNTSLLPGLYFGRLKYYFKDQINYTDSIKIINSR